MIAGVVPSSDIDEYRTPGVVPAERIRLLKKTPSLPHAVVGTIDIRALRPKTAEQLIAELRRNARLLDADAVVPPPAAERGNVKAAGVLSPVQPFIVFDDGRTQTLEATAIRYQRTSAAEAHEGPNPAR